MNDFLQLCFAGLALGSRYALVALGFVVIHRATGVINFAQGSIVALGAYFTFNAHQTWGLPFWSPRLIAIVASAAVGVLVERFLLRRMSGQPVFSVIMITIGLLFVIDQVITMIWGQDAQNLGDPWGIDTVIGRRHRDGGRRPVDDRAGAARGGASSSCSSATAASVWRCEPWRSTRKRRWPAASRCGASSAPPGRSRAPWRRSPASRSRPARLPCAPAIGLIALAAFPAMILGGLDSPLGAVLGGVIIGLTQILTAGYQPQHAAWLGNDFQSVTPYVVMILILMVRPYGLFGSEGGGTAMTVALNVATRPTRAMRSGSPRHRRAVANGLATLPAGHCLIAVYVVTPLVLSDFQLTDRRLRRYRSDRCDRAQRAHRVHGPDLARPRLLPRRRRLRRGLRRWRARAATTRVAAGAPPCWVRWSVS